MTSGTGYGKGYKLAHHEEHKVAAGMRCLPDSLAGRTYYQPTEEGRESSSAAGAAAGAAAGWAAGAAAATGAAAAEAAGAAPGILMLMRMPYALHIFMSNAFNV